MGKIPVSHSLLVVHSEVFSVHDGSFEFEYFDRLFFF